WVLEAEGLLLGPSPEAVKLTGDKFALFHHLIAYGIPTPATQRVALLGSTIPSQLLPGVCKPRNGAGSLHTHLVSSTEDVRRIQEAHPGVEFLLQRLVKGLPASCAFLIGPGRCVGLPPAAQVLSGDGRFSYLGGRAPLPRLLAERARKLARTAV